MSISLSDTRIERTQSETSAVSTLDLRRLIIVTVQLALVMLAVYRFKIVDNFGFPSIVPLIFGGFVINALLPMRYRQTFFLLLSLAAIGVVLPFPFSLFLIGIALCMIGICHLPIRFSARVGLLLAIGVAMAALRNGWEAYPNARELAALVLPIIGSMFMFRLAIYLYDLKHEKVPASISERLSYFFMLPNVCFLLFPVIDYRTYRRTYYDKNEYDIYETGVLWILRGLTHLLLYRLVYGLFAPSAELVTSAGGAIEFMVATYMLYLRISGQFHLIVGILCLFGYNLPETHRLFYFASGFNDFWRRINIYWKDFMMKMVYYPVFVRLRGFGMVPGMVVATLAVFFGTWILHSYQWFWLRGTFPITATDGIFWGVLAVLVVSNSLMETRRGRKRSLSKAKWSWQGALLLSTKTVAMFSMMCVLWSLWNSASVNQWLQVVSNFRSTTLSDAGLLVLVLITLVVVGVIIQYAYNWRQQTMKPGSDPLLGNPIYYTLVVSALLLALTFPQITGRLPQQTAGVVDIIQEDRLNAHDRQMVERGYYEDLLDNPKFTSTLSIVRARQERPKTKDWVRFRKSEVALMTDEFIEYELVPSFQGSYWDAPIETNRWGMRDKDYTLQKPPGVYRIALLGASMEMAAGVNSEEVMEAVVEERLNSEHATVTGMDYELMNFSVIAYGMVQKFILMEQKIERFDPDMVIVPIYNSEEGRTLTHLANVVKTGRHIPYSALQDIVDRAGATSDMTLPEIRVRLIPHIYEVIEWSMRQLKTLAKERGYHLVPVFFPNVEEILAGIDEERHEKVMHAMSSADLDFLSLANVYDDHDVADIQLAPWETHLSVYGNKVAADGLYEVLTPILR